jgi:hypothetical protein
MMVKWVLEVVVAELRLWKVWCRDSSNDYGVVVVMVVAYTSEDAEAFATRDHGRRGDWIVTLAGPLDEGFAYYLGGG